jgi:hypothetical protein
MQLMLSHFKLSIILNYVHLINKRVSDGLFKKVNHDDYKNENYRDNN